MLMRATAMSEICGRGVGGVSPHARALGQKSFSRLHRCHIHSIEECWCRTAAWPLRTAAPPQRQRFELEHLTAREAVHLCKWIAVVAPSGSDRALKLACSTLS